jgi:hypothetical protein
LKKTYERLSNQLSILNEDLEIKDTEKIRLEKNQLFETVNAISDEVYKYPVKARNYNTREQEA